MPMPPTTYSLKAFEGNGIAFATNEIAVSTKCNIIYKKANICNTKCKRSKEMEKICGIYKITNTITGDFYIGSSKNIKKRWTDHKKPSRWSQYPNNPMYLDFQKYGVDKFELQVLEEVEIDSLKETEQQFIEKLQPTYNDRNANGWDIERLKESKRKAKKKYNKSDKGKESKRKYDKKYNNQLCCYNGETLTLNALSSRFRRKGISNPTIEAKKYLLNK